MVMREGKYFRLRSDMAQGIVAMRQSQFQNDSIADFTTYFIVAVKHTFDFYNLLLLNM